MVAESPPEARCRLAGAGLGGQPQCTEPDSECSPALAGRLVSPALAGRLVTVYILGKFTILRGFPAR
jgi:hypothetical protein